MKTKKQFKYFSIFNHEKEQEYLRFMHNSGWKFTRVTGLGTYHFEACQPEDVIYQLDYNQEGLAHKEEYVRLFQDCGWEYLQDYVGYSYFRKSASQTDGAEEIFCDDSWRRFRTHEVSAVDNGSAGSCDVPHLAAYEQRCAAP